MSWGGLPFWFYELSYEHDLALAACAFDSEWFSGTSKAMPKHNIQLSKATFQTWDVGGRNHQKELNESTERD